MRNINLPKWEEVVEARPGRKTPEQQANILTGGTGDSPLDLRVVEQEVSIRLQKLGLIDADLAALMMPTMDREQRLRQLFDIGVGVRSLSAQSPDSENRWLRSSNEKLGGRSPLQVMLEDADGVARVHDHVLGQMARGAI